VLRGFWWDLVVAVWKSGSVKCFEDQFTWVLEPVMETTRVLVSPWYLGDFFICTELRLSKIAGGAKSHVAATGDHVNALSSQLLSKLKSQLCTWDMASYQSWLGSLA
jgi:hypothetical protein